MVSSLAIKISMIMSACISLSTVPDVTVQSSNDQPQLDQLEDTHDRLGDTHNSPDQLEHIHDSK